VGQTDFRFGDASGVAVAKSKAVGVGTLFERTSVLLDGKAHINAALLIVVLRTSLPLRLFKCDNFEPPPQKMVVTAQSPFQVSLLVCPDWETVNV
jgi:hypothetical protein